VTPVDAPGPAREHLRITGTVRPDDAADFVSWAQGQVDARRIEGFALTPASLEDVYIRLVGSHLPVEETTDNATQTPAAVAARPAGSGSHVPALPGERA